MRDTKRWDEARATLAGTYNWFAEGIDTADLNDAKGLLDEWRVHPELRFCNVGSPILRAGFESDPS